MPIFLTIRQRAIRISTKKYRNTRLNMRKINPEFIRILFRYLQGADIPITGAWEVICKYPGPHAVIPEVHQIMAAIRLDQGFEPPIYIESHELQEGDSW